MPLPRYVFQENKATSKDGNQISPAVYTSALCSGAAALRSLKNLNVRPGSLVVISGIGGSIGHLAGQLARKVFNLKVIGVDWAHKRENLCHPGSITSDVFDIFVPAPENESQQDTYQQNIFLACVELRGSNIKPRKADGLIITASSAAAYNRISDYVCSGGSIVCVG
jgi:propanol-preferring alcohol dehydrogenase